MNTLTRIRDEIVTDLEAEGLTVTPWQPERLAPPCIAVIAGAPYVTPADQYGTYEIRHQILVCAGPGANSTQTTTLDELLARALIVLDARCDSVEAGQPFMAHANNAAYLSAIITTTHTTPLETT